MGKLMNIDPPDEGNESGGGWDTESQESTQVVVKPKTKTPSFYRVIILNDDFTPRDFVVHILQKFFRKSENEATQLMLDVHQKGAGVAGVYTYEIAETKAIQANEYSRKNHHPLQTVVEKE